MTARTFTFTVEAPSTGVSWVPALGQYANIPTTNWLTDQRTTFSEGFTSTAAKFSELIDSWGTSRRAAIGSLGSVLVFGGGHTNGSWNGVYRFDIATATWSTQLQACGESQNGKRIYFFNGEGGDDVYGEFYASADGLTVHAGEPAARHPYNGPLWLPPGSIGSDPLGYYYSPWAAAITGSGNQSARGAHYTALSNPSARWTRFGLWTSSGRFGPTLYDSLRNRVVGFPAATSTRTNSIRFHELPSGTMTTSTVSDALSSSGLRNKDAHAFYWAAQDLYIHIGGDQAVSTQCIKIIHPATRVVTTITTAPAFSRTGSIGGWEWVEDWQQLIYMDLNLGGSARVHRFTPSANPTVDPWTYQTYDLTAAPGTSGITLDTGSNHPSIYGRLTYHASIGAFISMARCTDTIPPQVLNIPRYQ